MAPKAAKPKEKSEETEKKVEYVQLQDLNPLKKLTFLECYLLLGIISLIFIIVLAVAIYYYFVIKTMEIDKIEESLRKLRRSMALATLNPYLIYGTQREMAFEFTKLTDVTEKHEEIIAEGKNRYQNLFRQEEKEKMGWGSFDNALYYISKELKTWYDAENFCMSRDSHLASILTTEEQKYITKQFTEPVWIGLFDENMEGDWKWTDGSSLVTKYWAPHNSSLSKSANTMDQDCAFIDPFVESPNWKKDDCFALKRWICKESMETE